MPAKKDQPQQAADQTEPGGRYVVNGVTVDANGKPIQDSAPAESASPDSGNADEGAAKE